MFVQKSRIVWGSLAPGCQLIHLVATNAIVSSLYITKEAVAHFQETFTHTFDCLRYTQKMRSQYSRPQRLIFHWR